jgi:hypothetical protein
MYRYDYILRLIERFGQALRVLRDRILRREVKAADMREELREVASLSGLDLDVARRLDGGMLLMWLSPTGDVDPPRFWLMGELLYLEGLAARQEGGGDTGRADLEAALTVFSQVPEGWRPQEDLASAGERIAEIRGMLKIPNP